MKSAPRRLLLRVVAVLAMAVSSLAVSAAPAHAGNVSNTIRWGESSTVQWINEGNTCWEGTWIPYSMKAEWNYATENSSLYVYSVRFTFWNLSSYSLQRGNAGIHSGSSFARLYPTYETINPGGVAFTRTLYVNRSLAWYGNKYITFYVSVSSPCGGYKESAFQLVKGYY